MQKIKSRDVIYIFLFLILVFALWTGLYSLPTPTVEVFPFVSNGNHDLTDTDFSETIYKLAQAWETWPEKLYTPEQLKYAEKPVAYNSSFPFATHRVTLKLNRGVTYGITSRSSDYAMRMFMNGEEIVAFGNPAATEEENIPQVQELVYYFTPQEETVEIVLQSSNYVHYRDGTKAPAFIIGTADNIAQYVQSNILRSGIIFGCLMVAFLYHFVVFILNRQQQASLLFSLICLMMALYSVGNLFTLTLTIYRFGYVAMILSFAGLVQLLNILFNGILNKWVIRAYYMICGAYLLLSLIAHTMLVSRVLIIFQAISIGMIVYYLICLAITLREKKLKNLLAFLGFALFGLSAIFEMLYKNSLGPRAYINNQTIVNSGAGMVLLVVCYAIILAIEQAEVNLRLLEANAALLEAEERYKELSEQKLESESLPVKLSDFGLSKRETEVALLLLDGKSRDEIAGLLFISMGTVNTHCTHIYRKAGCRSVTEFTRLALPSKDN